MLPCAPAFFRASMRAYECANGRASYSSGRTARVCGRSCCASCCQRAGQGYSHRNRRHRRQCSWKHSRRRCRKDSQTCARGSTRPAPLPETQHPPCMRSRRKTRLLKTTMQEAEKAIEELMAVVDKEKKKAAEPQVFHRHEELCERA